MTHKVEVYSIVKDRVIVAVVHTSNGMDGVLKSCVNQKWEYTEIVKVPVTFEGKKKMSMDEFNADFSIKLLSERVADGYVVLPENHKLDGEKVRPMTLKEKVAEGREEIPDTMKFAEDSEDQIIPKTEAELVADGVKTQKEIDDQKQTIEDEKLIAAEIRKMAIATLGSKVKIVKA